MCPHSRRKGSPEGVPRFPGSFQIWGALRRLKPNLVWGEWVDADSGGGV